MKITKERLKQIIKEEIEEALRSMLKNTRPNPGVISPRTF